MQIKDRIKHFFKIILKKKDLQYEFLIFKQNINSRTIKNNESIINFAEKCLGVKKISESREQYLNSNDPIVRNGYDFKEKIEKEFKLKYQNLSYIRILIHCPPSKDSMAGYSIFNNLKDSLDYLGIKCEILPWKAKTKDFLENFNPTVLITSDNESYIDRIDWYEVKKYKKKNILKIGLTASLQEYGNISLKKRLVWAKSNNVDFYYSFFSPEYIANRKEYRPFFASGYKIFSIEFGANVNIYYPVPNIERDIDFVFLGSSNFSKLPRYIEYFSEIFSSYNGFIDGPGFSSKNSKINLLRDRYIYARAKAGINLHIENQILRENEINERTYNLASCGVPQLIDNPKLLKNKFSINAMFIANNPKEYLELFKFIINNPNEARDRALIAQKEVFDKHTTIHRAENFILDLMNNFNDFKN